MDSLTFSVILALLDTFTTEFTSKIVTFSVVKLPPPLLYNAEHCLSSVDSAIVSILPHSGMMENTVDNSIHSSSDICM